MNDRQSGAWTRRPIGRRGLGKRGAVADGAVHQQLVQQFAARSASPDVVTRDIVWIADFAGAGRSIVDSGGRTVKIADPAAVKGVQYQRRIVAGLTQGAVKE